MAKKKMTQIQLIKEFANQSVIHQLFITEALHSASNNVIENKEAYRKGMEQHIIAPNLWISIAEEWKAINNLNPKG